MARRVLPVGQRLVRPRQLSEQRPVWSVVRDIVRLAAAALLVVGSVAMAACSAPEPVNEAVPTATGEFGDNMVRCLSAKGWDVRADADDEVHAEAIPEAQIDQYRADRDACMAEFGYDEPPSITPEVASGYYDKMLALADCLRGLGYPVPDPPSREAFVEELVATGGSSWFPYEAVQDAAFAGDADAFREADAACPQPTSW